MKKTNSSRREFLQQAGAAGAAVAAPYVITSTALGAEDRAPASDRIVMAGIGIGRMGKGDQGAFLNRGDVQYVAACEVVGGKLDAAKGRVDKKYGNTDCQTYGDFRELLAREDIDAVHVGTPDHWHAIMVIESCRHGKDVYCQKPETRTLREGPLMIEAARRYARVVSGGSQRVLGDYRKIVDPCWNGEHGNIKSINVNLGMVSQPCNLPAEDVPEDMDWDMWLGPAPWAPYNHNRCSDSFAIDGKSSWRSFEDYSGGHMTDWGAHHLGGATFAIDAMELQPTDVTYHSGDKPWLSFKYPNGIELTINAPGKGNHHVEGDGEKREAKPVPSYKGNGGIYGDFIDCAKTREKPFRDIQRAVNTIMVAHLGIAAYRLQRSLQWDAQTQQFVGDEEANRLLDRARREPWQI